MSKKPVVYNVNELSKALDYLLASFHWDSTEEGYEYWEDVYTKLLRIHDTVAGKETDVVVTKKIQKKKIDYMAITRDLSRR